MNTYFKKVQTISNWFEFLCKNLDIFKKVIRLTIYRKKIDPDKKKTCWYTTRPSFNGIYNLIFLKYDF